MAAIPVEFLKGHDNSPNGFKAICYIRLPMWLTKKIMRPYRITKENHENVLFQVVEETAKAYRIIFVKDASISYDFCRPTWYIDYVPKSLVELVRTDTEQYEKEVAEYFMKEFEKKETK